MMNRYRILAATQRLATLAALILLIAACSEGPLVPEAEGTPFVGGDAGSLFSIENTTTGDALFGTSEVLPSTNEENVANGWANVQFVDVAVGSVTLAFEQPRSFAACFEYRADDEATSDPRDNFNTDVTDGLWPFLCLNGSSDEFSYTANSHVDIRMVFGAERGERFDWTRFYVLSLENKDQCKSGVWEELGFRNQGQCVRFVETGKDSRTAG